MPRDLDLTGGRVAPGPTGRLPHLLGGLGLAAVGATAVGVHRGVLPGRPAVQRLLHLNGAAGVVPAVAPGPVESGFLTSTHRPGRTAWSIARPPGATGPLPVVVALHGYGGSVATVLGPRLGVPAFLAAAVQNGVAPFAIAAIDGGTTYWHPAADGSDTGAMVTDDLLPLLADRGLVTTGIGLLGWSMGGYGALRLAGLLGADVVSAVVSVSPALWDSFTTHVIGGDPTTEGFADAADYATYGVIGKQHDLDGIAVRVDCGTGDVFHRAARRYVGAFPTGSDVESRCEPGAHGEDYWRRVLPDQLAWLGARVGSTHAR